MLIYVLIEGKKTLFNFYDGIYKNLKSISFFFKYILEIYILNIL